jgi:spore coat protein U-like protein
MTLPLRCALAAAALLGAAGGSASAGCSVEVDPVTFGTIDSQRLTRGNGEVVVRCDEPADFRVGLSPGRGGGEGRRMRGPGKAELDYALFTDPGYTIPWGDGQAIGNPRPGRSEGQGPVRLTVYGLIPPQPGALPGEYEDGLQVTLTF